jgi:hypothetical protein
MDLFAFFENAFSERLDVRGYHVLISSIANPNPARRVASFSSTDASRVQ